MGLTPDFASPIIAARAAGKRPADIVIVSDGDLGLHRTCQGNHVVRIDPEVDPRRYDFTCLAGLNVEIATEGDYDRSLALINALLPMRPDYLRLWWPKSNVMIRVVAFGRTWYTRESDWVCSQCA